MPKNKYETHVKPYLEKIKTWVEQGAGQEEIARNLHIAESTFALYLRRGRDGEEPYSELSALYAQACEEPDNNVEAALYKLACGYAEVVDKTFKVKISKFDPHTGRKISEKEELVSGKDVVYVPANVEAQKFWLANRRRDKWALKPEAESDIVTDNQGVIMMPEVPADDG